MPSRQDYPRNRVWLFRTPSIGEFMLHMTVHVDKYRLTVFKGD